MLDPRVILGQKPRKQALKEPRYFLDPSYGPESGTTPLTMPRTASCGKCLPENFESDR